MRRLLCPVCTVVLLAATPATSAAPDAGTAPATPVAALDAGTPAPADPPIAPERLAEARALVPPPLLYGQLQPVVGTWVEYTFQSKQGTFPVRAAVVGETPRERDTLYQVELDYQTTPRTLIVIWVSRAGTARALVERLAISLPPNAPVSIPVDLLADHAALRGTPVRERDTDVRPGPFAGKGREQTFRLESGQQVTVVTAARVPVFGVESLRDAESTWTARKAGTGARPSLDAVPLSLPRLPVP
ncbi:hypothetical protein [Corallococcus aberystwythensis]|uniref:DUF3108 domain-containing protein n=1 Tax=Corallococcus aberystwythensis TaxID=2316722 RepID=A0A3A8QF03_9BACT|nr:hypothetical protein [Corallococcus aberystwythensis]RKH66241.1 hypothetical protein D7W81_15785 [Corallococcus aberystwythensis]